MSLGFLFVLFKFEHDKHVVFLRNKLELAHKREAIMVELLAVM